MLKSTGYPDLKSLTRLGCLWVVLATGILFAVQEPIFAQSKANESDYYLFPLAGRLAGIGTFYGLGFYLENIASSTIDVGGGKSTGQIEATGAGFKDLNLFGDLVSLTTGIVQVDRLTMDLSYTRGLAEDDPVTQQGKAQGAALVMNWKMFEPMLKFSTTLAQWNYQFDSYLNADDHDKEIPLPQVHLGDLNSTFLINSLVFQLTNTPENPTSGLEIGLNLTSFTTTTQFSSTNTASYFLNLYLPLGENHSFVLRGFGSDAVVSSQKVTDIDEINQILAVDCSGVVDPEDQLKCQNLRDDIATYLAAHNEYGTAVPLGGNNMLRSYREGRFRAAHSRYFGQELRFSFPFGENKRFQTALFHERGTAADDLDDIGVAERTSYGLALRFTLGETTIRLETADGDEGSEWVFIVGNPW